MAMVTVIMENLLDLDFRLRQILIPVGLVMSCFRALSVRQKRRRVEEFRRQCRQRGIPFTTQRRLILQTVLGHESHPTADEVYGSSAVRRAGVSRATVYRTLENLVCSGAILKVSHEGNAARYDGRTELHHHLVCLKCGAVEDFHSVELNAVSVPDTSAAGFVVRDFRMQLRGLCSRCLKNKQND
jgi:Fe2+ or Zn2+ uptake regulation protein